MTEEARLSGLRDRVKKDFTYYAPRNDDEVKQHADINGIYLEVALAMVDMLPPGREQSLVLTKLEEARMHSNSAIARARAE